MPLADPTPHPVSACPVHFLWDGRGIGRTFVRSGFLGFLAAAMILSAGRMLHIDVVTTAGMAVTLGALAVWSVGQVLTLRVKRRALLS